MSTDDFVALQRLVFQYSDAVNRRDRERWADCFVDDATWSLLGRTYIGKNAIVTRWEAAMDSLALVVHSEHDGDAWYVDADRGVGRWYVDERYRGLEGPATLVLGHYDDVYVRTADGWRFAERSLALSYRGAPDLSGSFESPAREHEG